MKQHYIYRITDTETDEYYIGARSCQGLAVEDVNYMGSTNYWSKDDYHKLEKEVLGIFPTRRIAFEVEYDVIMEVYKENDLCVNGKPWPAETFLIDRSGENNPCSGLFGKNHPASDRIVTEEERELISKRMKEYYKKNDTSRENNSNWNNGEDVYDIDNDMIHANQSRAAEYNNCSQSKIWKHLTNQVKNPKFKYVE